MSSLLRQPNRRTTKASAAATRVVLMGAMLEPFQDNVSAREVVTTTDDTGMVQFVPNTILRVDGSRLSDLPIKGRFKRSKFVFLNWRISGFENTESIYSL